METLGTIPQQLRYVLVVLIPKATTGLRPIGIFCALYRLWAKCRTTMARYQWRKHGRTYLAASKGRAVTEPIRRHAAAVECGVYRGQETVSVWRDIAQCYECMEHHILQAYAETFGFPLPVLRVAVSACRMQRVLVLHGEAAPTGHPPGEWWLDVPSPPIWSNCTACLCWTMLCGCILVSRSMFFIDESHPISPGHTNGRQEPHRGCGTNSHQGGQKHLRVRFADKKTAIVSSHRKLALSEAHHLGMQEESVKTQTVGLGVDVTAGKARAATTTRRRKRMRKRSQKEDQAASANETSR